MRSETKIGLPELDGRTRQPEVGRSHGYLFGGLSLGAIWLSVILMGVFAPDLVTGAEQDRFPLAVVVGLLAGLAATRSVVRAFAHMGSATRTVWIWYAMAVGLLWLAVALAAILLPVSVTGADPTRLPMAVVIAPIGGTILTGAITEVFISIRR